MSVTPKIKVIAFDCGGVFANDIPGDMFATISSSYGEEAKRIAASHDRNKDLWNRFKLEPEFSEEKYWLAMIERESLKESVDTLKAALRESIIGYDLSFQIAEQLMIQGYTLALLSNHSTEWFSAIDDKLQISKYIPKSLHVVSQAVQAAKPDAQVYAVLYEKLQVALPGLEKSEILFLDDTERNITAANEFGLTGVIYDARVDTKQTIAAKLKQHALDIQ